MNRFIKFQILYCTIFAIVFYSLFLPLLAWCYEPVKTVVITKEDIMNAKATPEPVELDEKELHAVEVMEKRHFPRTYPEFSQAQRLKNLEFELLGRVWEFSPQKERLKRLKLASSNVMVAGVALPAAISSKRNVKRMRNDEIQIRKRDDVGLIDGFLRLVNPNAYNQLRKTQDRLFEYEY